jgi:hypothetical protein
MHVPVSLLLCAIALLPLRQVAEPAATPATSVPAQDPGPVYRNEALRLSYQYPAGYVDASALVGPALQASMSGEGQASAQCVTSPFSRMAAPPHPMALVLLLRADAGCLKKRFDEHSLNEFAAGEAKGIAASGARASFGQPAGFKVGSHPASSVRGDFTLPTGQVLQAEVVCVLDKPDVVCWQFLAADAASLAVLATFPVTFDGGTPAALTTPAAH